MWILGFLANLAMFFAFIVQLFPLTGITQQMGFLCEWVWTFCGGSEYFLYALQYYAGSKLIIKKLLNDDEILSLSWCYKKVAR